MHGFFYYKNFFLDPNYYFYTSNPINLKTRYITSFLFLFCFIVLKGQNSNKTEDVHSLTIQKLLDEAVKLMYDDISKALQKTKEAEAILTKHSSTKDSAAVFYRFAVLYYIKGDYGKSQDHFYNADKLYENLNDLKGMANCANGKGLIQMGIKNFEQAIEQYEEAKNLFLSSDHQESVSATYFNIGIAQIESKKYDEAYVNFHKSLNLARKYEKFSSEHMTMNRLADIHYRKMNFDSSYYYLDQLMNHPVPPSNWELAFAYLQLSKLDYEIKAFDLAEKNALYAVEYASKVNAKWDLSKAHEQLYRVYKVKLDIQKALYHLELFDLYKDTLFNENQLRESTFLQLQSIDALNKKLIIENDFNQQKLKTSKLISFFIGLALLSFILIIVQLMKNIKMKDRYNKSLDVKNKAIENQNILIQNQNNSLIELNDHKLKMLSVLSHDMRGPLNLTIQILKMSNEGFLSEDERNDLLLKLESQANKTLEMLEEILEWAKNNLENSKTETVKVSLEKLLRESVINFEHLLESKNIIINWQIIASHSQIIADISHAKIVIYNLISNAIKYSPKNSEIILKISEEKPYIKMHIIDKGIGISDENLKTLLHSDKKILSTKGTANESGTGIGILLVKQFLTLNNAYLEINNKRIQGTEFIVYWPKSIV